MKLRYPIGGLCALALFCAAAEAGATGPREFPDLGGAAFARGGAWLAVGTDPVAAHFNPAAMATMRSAVSLGFNLVFNQVCYERKNPGDAATGPRQGTSDTPGNIIYRPVCNRGSDRPGFVPAIAGVWRVTDDLALGLAVVPPSAYGTSENDWPDLSPGYNTRTGETATVPAPYRYMTLGNASTVLFPTLSAGYEIIDGLRVGAGFVWGLAFVDADTTGIARVETTDLGDHAGDDSRTELLATDAFVPGFVVSVHGAPWRKLDLSVWYRWLDKVRSESPTLDVDRPFYDSSLTGVSPICASTETEACPGQSIKNHFDGQLFEFAFPMELRIGVRFHEPFNEVQKDVKEGEFESRDPLRDDLFDIELDASWTNASNARNIVARFAANERGEAVLPVKPQGLLPPNGDRDEGYRDTFGARLGGQLNVIRDKLGLMVGTWIESAANDDEYLSVDPVAALRGGFGGGVVLRQEALDIHIGYQRHWNAGYDNQGNGVARATSGTRAGTDEPFRIGGPLGDNEFRSYHTINGGKVVQSANVFAMEATLRF
jgi:long-chain fatty acid transport protein